MAATDHRDGVEWRTELLVDNRWVTGEGPALDVIDPTTEARLVTLPTASAAQVDAAVAAARRAFDAGRWARDHAGRAAGMRRLADLVEDRTELLAASIVHDVGTPISTALALQVGRAVELLRWHADATGPERVVDLGVSTSGVPCRSTMRSVPVGTVAAITAYNYPLLLAAAKLGGLWAAGCTAVLLPSPQAPLSTLLLAELVLEADLPPGVVNVVVGGAEIGRALSEHPGIDKISFTGSAAVGAAVMAQASSGLRGVMLELGGKSPAVLLPDADLPAIVERVHDRYFRNAGQGCQSPTRVLVHESRYDELVDLSRPVFADVRVGDPWDPETIVGPVISAAHRTRVLGYLAGAEREGGKVVAGGGTPSLERGWFVNPALVGGVDNRATICQEEIFGPVGVVLPYRDVEHAVEIANDSLLGLAATVWGPLDQCLEVAPRLQAGTVTINGGGAMRPDSSICGWKRSGIGSEWGADGIREFLVTQHLQWPEG